MPEIKLFMSANKHITGFKIANTVEVTNSKSSPVMVQYITCHSYAEMFMYFHCLSTDFIFSAIVEVIFIFLIILEMMLRRWYWLLEKYIAVWYVILSRCVLNEKKNKMWINGKTYLSTIPW